MKNRLLCTVLIFMMLFLAPVKAYADAGTIAITGGSIAVGGVGTIATGAIAGPVVVAVFCGMMAMGMNIELTQASQQAGMTKTQYLKNKLEQYCNEAQITYGVFNNAILDGTTILANGSIKLGSQAGTRIKQFIDWLWNSNQVSENVSAGEGTVSIAGLNLPLISSLTARRIGYSYSFGYTTTEDCAFVITVENGINQLFVITNKSGVMGTRLIDGTPADTYEISGRINGYYYLDTGIGGARGVYDCNPDIPIYNGTLGNFLNSADGSFDNSSSETANNGFTGDRDAWSSGSNVLDQTPGQSIVINPGLVGGISVPVGTDVTVSIRDYLDALQKVLDKIQAGLIAKDKETDIPITIPIPVDTDVDPTIDKEDDKDLPAEDEQTPVQDPDKPVDPEQDPEGATAPLKFNITNIFPFCIPFDIKDMLSLLNSEPVAPSYHVRWMVPIVNTPIEFTIDLSPWNSVALIARKMELLSFIVGLAVLTRNLIRG